MKNRELIDELLERIEALEEAVDFLLEDEDDGEAPFEDEADAEFYADVLHDAHEAQAVHPDLDRDAFVSGYIAHAMGA